MAQEISSSTEQVTSYSYGGAAWHYNTAEFTKDDQRSWDEFRGFGDVTIRTTSGGHLGLFMGREALRDYWPPLLADVLTHSRPHASRARAARRARDRTPAGRGAIPAP